jgi:hypothetical protein
MNVLVVSGKIEESFFVAWYNGKPLNSYTAESIRIGSNSRPNLHLFPRIAGQDEFASL